MKKGGTIIVFGFCLSALAIQVTKAMAQERVPEAEGKKVYERYCQGCHGVEGDGKGPDSRFLDPQPRDFTRGSFKCRSTPSGSLPTDDDLFRTITRGVHGTAMPRWRPLLESERRAVVRYIKTFSKRFQEEKPEPPIVIREEPPLSPESIAAGKQVYETAKCWECHGYTGKGDGPSAAKLQDDLGNPIRPYDFTNPEAFKCGSSAQDIYRTFTTGMDGTPMPSFTETLSEEQRWQLVHYVMSLRKPVERPIWSRPFRPRP